MIYIITGSTHTGKTNLSQKLMEKLLIPYLSIDHLKMGLIRSHTIDVSVEDDEQLTMVLWPIVVKMIQTAIENNQSMIIEGCYVPLDWKSYFQEEHLSSIYFVCLIMSKQYIEKNYNEIVAHSSIIESRMYPLDLSKEDLISMNQYYLDECRMHKTNYYLIEDHYRILVDEISCRTLFNVESENLL